MRWKKLPMWQHAYGTMQYLVNFYWRPDLFDQNIKIKIWHFRIYVSEVRCSCFLYTSQYICMCKNSRPLFIWIYIMCIYIHIFIWWLFFSRKTVYKLAIWLRKSYVSGLQKLRIHVTWWLLLEQLSWYPLIQFRALEFICRSGEFTVPNVQMSLSDLT